MLHFNINPYAEQILGKVELYQGSTLLQVCSCGDVLQDFTVERVGENGKFFGFGICQKTSINLIDMDRVISVSTANSFKNYFGDGENFYSPYPIFNVTEVNRDESTNTLSITAYDTLYKASTHTVAEINLEPNYEYYCFLDVLKEITDFLGLGYNAVRVIGDATLFSTTVNKDNINFDGAESLRDVLNAIAEITHSIYYLDYQNRLTFKVIFANEAPSLTIDRDKYYMLDSKTNRRLSAICSATELGDNLVADTGVSGTTQYIRNNPLLELRTDVAELLDKALANVGGLTLNQFHLSWCGNFLLEIGDKIAMVTENGERIYSYILNDVVRFLGYVDEETQWEFQDNDNETAANPTSLGEVINQTVAKVDKVNKEITLAVSESKEATKQVSKLTVDLEGVKGTVEKAATQADELSGEVATLTNRVDAQITPEQVALEIQKELNSGVSKVETTTGFIFDESGLTVSKSNSEMTTQITQDGMKVYRNNDEVLTADNQGVKAENLHATTYLIVGTTSRFEDWNGRTGCFWIGG